MSRIIHILSPIILLLSSAGFLYAYWPTTVQENFPVAVDPDTSEVWCEALPYGSGRTLIIVDKGWIGNCYQVIDKYGETLSPLPIPLTPAVISGYEWEPHLISDGEGGAIIAWRGWGNSPVLGIRAQRLDSECNLLWGDSGIVISPFVEDDFDICPDGEGGFFLAVSPDEGAAEFEDLYMQHIDAGGNILWGPNGVLISGLALHGERYPRAAHCDLGGAFVVWEDHRPPYTLGCLFAQRISDNGNIIWQNALNLNATNVYFHQMIPDGAGGFLLHTDPGGNYYNTVYRVSPTGNILWQRYQVSSDASANMLPGDSLYFYLAFLGDQGHSYYAQKMDMNNNTYWPTFGSLQGALMSNFTNYNINNQSASNYTSPYFYGINGFCRGNMSSYPRFMLVQKLDSNGERLWGNNGVLIGSVNDGNYQSVNAVSDGSGGIVMVYEKYSDYDIWAKRIMDGGILGGALHLLVDMEPQNPPIQIQPGGGSFRFNLTIEDTYSVSGIFDAWIEATLPNGQDLEILHRDNITIQPNSVIERPNMTQVVPANAPAGTYIYHLYVGNREYDDVWAEDSFEFVKIE